LIPWDWHAAHGGMTGLFQMLQEDIILRNVVRNMMIVTMAEIVNVERVKISVIKNFMTV
jgi:hypothetical protein